MAFAKYCEVKIKRDITRSPHFSETKLFYSTDLSVLTVLVLHPVSAVIN